MHTLKWHVAARPSAAQHPLSLPPLPHTLNRIPATYLCSAPTLLLLLRVAELSADDFELMVLHGDSFATGSALARAVKAAQSRPGAADANSGLSSARGASDVVMVAAAALSAQVYPDSRCGTTQLRVVCVSVWV
jgi:hypothetical protein